MSEEQQWKHSGRATSARRNEPSPFPIIQWNHAQGAWELPAGWFDTTDAEAGEGAAPCIDRAKMPELVEIDHTETTDVGWLFKTLHILVLHSSTRWQKKDERGNIILAPAGLQRPHEEGYRSKTTALVVVAELWKAGYKGVAIMTTHAVASQQFGNALRRLDAFIDRADELAGQKPRTYYPRYAFWLELSAGPVRLVGSAQKKAKVCDILCPLASPDDKEALAEITEEQVTALKIRSTMKEPVEALYEAGQAWLDELAARAAQRSSPAASPAPGARSRRFAEEPDSEEAPMAPPRPAGRTVVHGNQRTGQPVARAAAARPGPAARRT